MIRDIVHSMSRRAGCPMLTVLVVFSLVMFLGYGIQAGSPNCKSKASDPATISDGTQQVNQDSRDSSSAPLRSEPKSIETRLSECLRERDSARKEFDEAGLAYKTGKLTWNQLFEAYDRWSRAEQTYCQLLFYSQLTQNDLVKAVRERSFSAGCSNKEGGWLHESAEELSESRRIGASH